MYAFDRAGVTTAPRVVSGFSRGYGPHIKNKE